MGEFPGIFCHWQNAYYIRFASTCQRLHSLICALEFRCAFQCTQTTISEGIPIVTFSAAVVRYHSILLFGWNVLWKIVRWSIRILSVGIIDAYALCYGNPMNLEIEQ